MNKKNLQPNLINDKDFYTLKEMADILGVHYNTIRKILKKELLVKEYIVKDTPLNFIKIGNEWRIPKESIKNMGRVKRV